MDTDPEDVYMGGMASLSVKEGAHVDGAEHGEGSTRALGKVNGPAVLRWM